MQLIPLFTQTFTGSATRQNHDQKYVCCCVISYDKQAKAGSGAQWGSKNLLLCCRALRPIFNARVGWSSSTSLLPNQPPAPMCKPQMTELQLPAAPKNSLISCQVPPQSEARGWERMASHVAAARAVETHSRVEIPPEKHFVF